MPFGKPEILPTILTGGLLLPLGESASFSRIFEWARRRVLEAATGTTTKAERAEIRAEAKAAIDHRSEGNKEMAAKMKASLDKDLNALEKAQDIEASERNVFSRIGRLGSLGIGLLVLAVVGGLFLRVRGR